MYTLSTMGDTSQYRSIDRKDELYYCSNWLSTYGRRCPSNFRRMPSIVSLLSPKPKAAAMVVYLSAAANERYSRTLYRFLQPV